MATRRNKGKKGPAAAAAQTNNTNDNGNGKDNDTKRSTSVDDGTSSSPSSPVNVNKSGGRSSHSNNSNSGSNNNVSPKSTSTKSPLSSNGSNLRVPQSPSSPASPQSASEASEASESEAESPTQSPSSPAPTLPIHSVGSPSSSISSPSGERVPDPSLALSEQAVAAARADTTGRVYRVYSDGIFDLFHVGHMKMLEQAKKSLGEPAKIHLIVGVCSDELTIQHKGKTVMDHATRCESVRHCKWADEVAPDAPWHIDDAFIAKYRIDFVAHDAIPYMDKSGTDVYAHIKERAMFLETKRTEGISTSDLIVTIVRDYDAFVERNLSRGYSKKQLNVGRTWEVRSAVHEKTKKLDAATKHLKAEYKDLSDTARSFMKEFQPQGTKGAREYAKRLRQRLPASSKGLMHHCGGLTRASGEWCVYFLSYFNPFSYCTKKKYTKK